MHSDYPWERPGLTVPERLTTMMDCLLDVDTFKGTVIYRHDVGQYHGKWRPYRPVTRLRFSAAGTSEVYELGVKELVWVATHRRFPTGIRLHNPLREQRLYAEDNLYQLEVPPLSKRYGWEYAAGRLPALVDTVEVTAAQALVRILPHNFVLEADEEHHQRRRKLKMRLMRQLTQSNLKLNSYWRVPLMGVGRVTRELLFLNNPHPNFQPAYPPMTADSVIPVGEVIRPSEQVCIWSTRRQEKPGRGEYVERRREELAEHPPQPQAPQGKVRSIRGMVAREEDLRTFDRELWQQL